MHLTRKISPCLWFDNQAEEAASFYVSIFKNSKITNIARYGKAGHDVHGRKIDIGELEHAVAG
jgi:predicted 3-demethylubiquinone-9 3-methyltransferase (glyoxalase superfamily)